MPITKPFLLVTSGDGWYPQVLVIVEKNRPKESIILAFDIGFGFVASGMKEVRTFRTGF